ncbi:MAG: hypothetical protein Hens3KO_20260 [Henriciella sp.]
MFRLCLIVLAVGAPVFAVAQSEISVAEKIEAAKQEYKQAAVLGFKCSYDQIVSAGESSPATDLVKRVQGIVSSCQQRCVDKYDISFAGRKCQIAAMRGQCVFLADKGRYEAPCIELREDEREVDSAHQDVMALMAMASQ